LSDCHITVLGANGFIGSHVVQHLRAIGHHFEIIDRGDTSLMHRPLGDVLYAIGLTADFRTRPRDTVEAHVCLLNELIIKGDFRSLTYLSSTRVYSGCMHTNEDATLQVNPNKADDLYNLSKLMGESICLHSHRSCMKVARLANVVGLRPDPNIFIDQMLEEGCRSGHVHIRTTLESKKDYLYIDDAVTLLTQIARSDKNGIFNVASGEEVSNARVLTALEKHMGFSTSVASDAEPLEFTAIDMSKTTGAFSFRPQKFDDYFPTFLESYRQKKGIVNL